MTDHVIVVPGKEYSSEAQREWKKMRKKPSIVYMKQMDCEFTVETNEGDLSAHPGDWVAHDPASGHFWPVDKEYVEMHYEEVSE